MSAERDALVVELQGVAKDFLEFLGGTPPAVLEATLNVLGRVERTQEAVRIEPRPGASAEDIVDCGRTYSTLRAEIAEVARLAYEAGMSRDQVDLVLYGQLDIHCMDRTTDT